MLTNSEQFFLEQLNRARLNPTGEAERFGIGLNDPNPTSGSSATPATTIADGVRQPLAVNTALSQAAVTHSDAYLAGNVQLDGPNAGHHWLDGTTPVDRALDAGYGSSFVGENLSFSATTGNYNAEQAVLSGLSGIGHHQGLFYSITHRPNLLNADYTEAGIAQVMGDYTNSSGTVFNASVITNKFGREALGDRFLTGVAYDDHDGDGFYSLGEAASGVTITALGQTTTTASAGGYALNLGAQATPVTVVIDWQGQELRAAIDLSISNVKLDIVGGSRIMASSNLTLLDGVAEGGLLGAGDLALTGNSLNNILLVGHGNNVIDGAGGVNTAWFSGAFADYDITVTAGTITVNDQRASALGDGDNTLNNIQFLRFADGVYTPDGTLDSPVPQGQITLQTPAFGEFLSAQERNLPVTLSGQTQDIPEGTEVVISLNGQDATVRTTSGQWTYTLMPADLAGLANGTNYDITATAQTATGPVQTTFGFRTTFDAPTLGTFPSPFGATLTGADLMQGVSFSGVTSATSGTVTMTLAGVAHTATIADGGWVIDFPGATLARLTNGTAYQLPLQLVDQFDNSYNFNLTGFTASLDFPAPVLGIDALPFDGGMTAEIRDQGLSLTGSAQNVPDGVLVTVTLNGQTYTEQVSAGLWAVTIPADDLAALPDGTTLTATATTTVAGTNAQNSTSFTTEFTPPEPGPNPGDGPLTVSGALAALDDTPMAGAVVTFTPDAGAALQAASLSSGAFTLHPNMGMSGRLDASRDWQTGDPAITALDALDVLRLAVGLNPSFGPAQAQNFIAADVNGDGAVTALDALEVLRAAVGLQSATPPRWVFFDADTDFEAMSLSRTNTHVETGIDIATLNSSLVGIDMVGILLGNMDSVA
ncbi:dockerin type I domain-containing protein [Roseinatronobacter sp. NSM]|uniref:dockerin type I domain-containing protein n=1 Tax=Roseinatronobacter sp. NSM TaxID=3457785 RepID=UPI00403611AE